MKNKVKYVFCLFMGLLFICMMQMHTAYAAGSPSLSATADTASAAKGGYVNVSVNLSSNPSISTLGAALRYDSSVLKYVDASWSGGFSGSDMKMASDSGGEVNLSVVCDSSYSADGTVVTVRFQAVQDTSSIPVTLSLRDMADADLSAVSNCKVSSQVRVPNTSAGKNDASDKKDDTAELKVEAEPDSDRTERENKSSNQPSAGSTDTANVQNVSNASTGNAQAASVKAGSGVQSTSVQNAQAVSSSNTGSTKPDRNYQTGAGFGNDIFLMIAAACGILALMLAVRKCGEEKK